MKKVPFWTAVFLLVFALTALLFTNSEIWYARKDFSRDKVFSLSPFTQNMLSELSEKVQITYYVSEKLKNLYPQVRDVTELLYEYAASSAQISVSVVDPQKEGLEQRLSSLGIAPQQIETTDSNETSFVTVFSAITVEYNAQTEVIPFTLTTTGLEYDIDSRIQYLAGGKARRVFLVVGNGLSLTEDYKYLTPWLESAGFVCTELHPENLDEADTSVPLLVLGSSALNSEDVYHIESFVIRGGNAAFCVNRNSVNIYTDWKATADSNTLLPDLLSFWGIQVMPQLAMDISNYRIVMQSADGTTSQAHNEYINYPFWVVTLSSGANAQHVLTSDFYGLELYWPSPLELFPDEAKQITSVLKTTSAASLMPPPFDTDPFHERTKTDINGSFTLAAVLEGSVPGYYTTGDSEQTRLFVVGDQYAPSAMVEYTNSPHNIDFFVNVMLWLSGEDEMLHIRGKGFRTTALDKIADAEAFQGVQRKTLFFCFAVPFAAICAVALLVFVGRRRRNKHV